MQILPQHPLGTSLASPPAGLGRDSIHLFIKANFFLGGAVGKSIPEPCSWF